MRRLRARTQKGWLDPLANGDWQANWNEYILNPNTGKRVRRHRSRVVGNSKTMSKSEARNELQKLVTPMNEAVAGKADGRTTFSWFLDNKFIPAFEGNWGKSTRVHNLEDFNYYIRPVLGEEALEDIDIHGLQVFLGHLAGERNLSESVVKRCKTKVSSVLEYASAMEFIRRNPAKSQFYVMPLCKPTEKPVLQKEEMNTLWNVVTDVRDNLIVRVGTCCALTGSELFGLTWDCVFPTHLVIRSGVYRGKLTQWRVKRKARFRVVPIGSDIYRLFEKWWKLAASMKEAKAAKGKPEKANLGLVFSNSNGDGAIWATTFLQKRIQPLAIAAGIQTPITFQILRRSFATWNGNKRTKDTQSVMGHSNPQTTLHVYAQEVTSEAADLVARYSKEIANAKPKNQKRLIAFSAPKAQKSLNCTLTARRAVLAETEIARKVVRNKGILGAGDGDRTRDVQLGKP